jgi:PadR family transcriptional regulator, regulatory protein PadR
MDLLQGTLDMLVLRTLLFGSLHGYGIAKAIGSASNNALEIEFGSLYPALKRLEIKGWIASEWVTSEHNRRAKFYHLTREGRKRLRQEHSKWTEFVEAVTQVMGPSRARAALKSGARG